jgi:hypothetical protein
LEVNDIKSIYGMNIAVNVIITGLTPVGPVMKVLLHMKKLKPSHITIDDINYNI